MTIGLKFYELDGRLSGNTKVLMRSLSDKKDDVLMIKRDSN
jgi:hypothetical protein